MQTWRRRSRGTRSTAHSRSSLKLSIAPINARTVSVVVLVSTIVGRMLVVMIVVMIVTAAQVTVGDADLVEVSAHVCV